MKEFVFSSAVEQAKLIRERQVTCEEIMDGQLLQIDRHNHVLNAIVTVDAEGALTAARDADKSLARGDKCGPLHGVPVTVKDAIASAGIRNVCGHSPLLDFVPDRDASVVARMKAAGGIVIGKTNVPEKSSGMHCENPVFGRTNNPWDTSRSPGGSTGGGAAAIAAGMSALELGADIGGSVRIPAHFSGVLALKPTEHRVPLTGHIPPLPGEARAARHQNTIGPLARSVDDLELAFQLIAGPDSMDSPVPPVPCDKESVPSLSDLRVTWIDNFGDVPITRETRDALASLLDSLEDQGARIEIGVPPGVDILEMWGTHRALLLAEASSTMTDEELEKLADAAYLDPISITGQSTDAQGRTISDALRPTLSDFNTILEERESHIAAVERCFETTDVIISPVTSTPAIPHCEPGTPILVDDEHVPYWLAGVASTAPFSLSGNPSVIVPMVQSKHGLPIGVQITGPRWREMKLIATTRALLPHLRGYERPPGY